ncbi:MAG TPA: carboxypeptidase-like regulatory domain-containing protein [Terriglobia bacterium]|nr:carboxypeptidase-like regulatory domain-containing protein [Terriglobia bacterium]
MSLVTCHSSLRWGHSPLLLFLFVLAPPPLAAQTWNGSLEGVILDPSGAAIPGAQVALRNPSTGLVRKAATDEHGEYNFPLLPVGAYQLRVARAGFVGAERHLTLEVGQAARVDFALAIARGRTSITVGSEAPPVDTASPAVSEEISNRRVRELPLNGREFLQLALLAAGVTPPYANGASAQFNTEALGLGFSVNGQRAERNNFTLDGVSVMEPFAYSLTVNPSVDAIREFRVVESSYSAAQGVVSGAQVEVATRSGSNQFHGTAYEFLRNSALDAKNFFDDPLRPIPPYHQNQFGASLGGPIKRDRTFFFANYEGFRIRQSVTNTTLLPPLAIRAGDLSGTNPLTGQPFPAIINPATGKAFAGNQVPLADIDPFSQAILARVPLPNQPNAAPGANNNINVGLRPVTQDQFTVRLDHQLKPRHQLFARFVYFNSRQLFPFVPDVFAQNPSAPPGFGTNKNDAGRNLALGLTSVFRPTLINDFRFGYNYYFGTKEAQNIHSGFLASLGIARAPGSTNDGIPAINVPGYADLGDSDIFQPQIRKDNTLQFTDSMVWVKDRHTIQFGGDVRRLRLFYLVENFGQGIFDFSDGASSVSGTAFSDFLLGRPFLSLAQAGNSGGNDRLDYLGLYFTDEFHATRRLTLTYGLREEFNSPPTNADGRGAILDPTDALRFIVRNDEGQAQSLISNPLAQQLQQRFGLEFITNAQAGLPPSLIRPDWAGWAPRFGFAYDVSGDGRTAVRGGAGVFNSLGELDYAAETRLSAPISESLFGLDLCRFFGPGACGQSFAPPQLSYALAYQIGNQPPDGVSSPPNIRNGYVYEWSLSLDHELSPNTVLSVSYSGSDGHKLPRRSIQNQGVPNLPGVRRDYHPQPGSNQFSRATDVNSNYNALILHLERRFAHGLSLATGYTWGKSIDDASGLQGTDMPQDNYNLRAERGLSDFDVRQRFVLSSTWQLPFGRGRHWLARGPAASILGEWQAANIVTLETGQPLTAILGTALSGTDSNGTDRPNLIANPNLPAGQRDPSHWFNTAAFVPPPLYTDALGVFSIPGNEGRNVIIGPGFADWDVSLQRTFRLSRLSDRAGLVFRDDFFNLTNHPNFDRPGLIVGTSNFGRISSAQNSRQIQFALRVNW